MSLDVTLCCFSSLDVIFVTPVQLYPYTLTVDEIAAFEQKIDQMNRLVHSYMEAKVRADVCQLDINGSI